jgi:hypothetical protein
MSGLRKGAPGGPSRQLAGSDATSGPSKYGMMIQARRRPLDSNRNELPTFSGSSNRVLRRGAGCARHKILERGISQGGGKLALSFLCVSAPLGGKKERGPTWAKRFQVSIARMTAASVEDWRSTEGCVPRQRVTSVARRVEAALAPSRSRRTFRCYRRERLFPRARQIYAALTWRRAGCQSGSFYRSCLT